jgi:hypothetical protein
VKVGEEETLAHPKYISEWVTELQRTFFAVPAISPVTIRMKSTVSFSKVCSDISATKSGISVLPPLGASGQSAPQCPPISIALTLPIATSGQPHPRPVNLLYQSPDEIRPQLSLDWFWLSIRVSI